MVDEQNQKQAVDHASACSAIDDWPIEARISHRILIYAARRAPHAMNQFTVEDIVREEISREQNDQILLPLP